MKFAEISTLVGAIIGGILGPITAHVFRSRFLKKKEADKIVISYGNGYELFAPTEFIDYMYPVSMYREVDIQLFSQLCAFIDAYYRLRADKKRKIDGTWVATARGLLLKAQVLLFDFVKLVSAQPEYPPNAIQDFVEYANSVEEIINDELEEVREISRSCVF